jgi:hypothetical protein
MPLTPWAERFMDTGDGVIESLTPTTPSPVVDLQTHSIGVAAIKLGNALGEIFQPTPPTLRAMRRILDAAAAYSDQAFPDVETYRYRLYNPDEAGPVPQPAICLTGLAGSGKSTLLKALNKLWQPTVCDAGAGHRPLLRTLFYLAVRQHSSTADILRTFLNTFDAQQKTGGFSPEPSGKGENGRMGRLGSVSRALSRSQRLAYRDGLAAAVIDELQFVSQSDNANTLVTKILLMATYIGPPIVFASNYNMVHRLLRRGQQDRERLLSQPIVLLPEALSCEAELTIWEIYLTTCVLVAGGALAINPRASGELLHKLTFGLRRKLIVLIQIGYERARNQGRTAATVSDLEWAYRAPQYCTHRADVEELVKIELGQKSKRSDLVCPFEIEPTEAMARSKYQQEKYAEQTSNQATLSSLSPDEKRKYSAAGGTVKPASRQKKPTSRRAAKPMTAETLLDGLDRFHQAQGRKRT